MGETKKWEAEIGRRKEKLAVDKHIHSMPKSNRTQRMGRMNPETGEATMFGIDNSEWDLDSRFYISLWRY